MTEKSAIVPVRESWWLPENLPQALELADLLAKSGIVPKAYQGKPQDILVAMSLGAPLGLAPLQALQSIACINGRPSLYGDAMLAIVIRHPEYVDHEEVIERPADVKETAGLIARCTIQRRGKKPKVGQFSWAEAIRAKLVERETWKQYPLRMLQMRARALAIRDAFTDAILGLAMVEETEDLEPAPAAAPAETPKEGRSAQVLRGKLSRALPAPTPVAVVEAAPQAEAEPVEREREPGQDG